MEEAYFTRIANIIIRRLEELNSSVTPEERITTINAALSIAQMERNESANKRQMDFQREMTLATQQPKSPALFMGTKATDLNGKEVNLEELPPQVRELFQRFHDGPPTPGTDASGS